MPPVFYFFCSIHLLKRRAFLHQVEFASCWKISGADLCGSVLAQGPVSIPWHFPFNFVFLLWLLTFNIRRKKTCFDYGTENTTFSQDVRKRKTLWNSGKNWFWQSKDINLHRQSIKDDPEWIIVSPPGLNLLTYKMKGFELTNLSSLQSERSPVLWLNSGEFSVISTYW